MSPSPELPTVTLDDDGTVHAPAFSVPLSPYLSETARTAFVGYVRNFLPVIDIADIAACRALWDLSFYAPRLARARALYPVHVEEREIAGVPAQVVTPEGGADPGRVLINLHGGAFVIGGGMGGLLESVPIASLGGITVISLDYRQAPEHQHPAGCDDVTAVYRTLLKSYPARRIGIYGCSAGGLLTAMAVARLGAESLERPGAIGLLCAAGDCLFDGDSRYTAPPLMGMPPPPPHLTGLGMMDAYLGDADRTDPLVSPVGSPGTLAQFPPTLVVTGTRSGEMSAAIHTHTQLVKAGVEAALHVWEGMWHGFINEVELPEAQEAFSVIAGFFRARL